MHRKQCIQTCHSCDLENWSVRSVVSQVPLLAYTLPCPALHLSNTPLLSLSLTHKHKMGRKTINLAIAIFLVNLVGNIMPCIAIKAVNKHHVVGGDQGWDTSTDVASWSANKNFHVGDTICKQPFIYHFFLPVIFDWLQLCRVV